MNTATPAPARAREPAHDAARSRILQALARRVDAQPEAVRRILQARLQAQLAQHAVHEGAQEPARLADAAPPSCMAARRSARKAETSPSPLAELNRALREQRPDAPIAPGGDELASARRFRASWDAQRALEKLEQALAHKPAQAGPLNSHALLLQSMELMRALSPHYLRHFLMHAETLLWLDAAAEAKSAKAKPARSRRKK